MQQIINSRTRTQIFNQPAHLELHRILIFVCRCRFYTALHVLLVHVLKCYLIPDKLAEQRCVILQINHRTNAAKD